MKAVVRGLRVGQDGGSTDRGVVRQRKLTSKPLVERAMGQRAVGKDRKKLLLPKRAACRVFTGGTVHSSIIVNGDIVALFWKNYTKTQTLVETSMGTCLPQPAQQREAE